MKTVTFQAELFCVVLVAVAGAFTYTHLIVLIGLSVKLVHYMLTNSNEKSLNLQENNDTVRLRLSMIKHFYWYFPEINLKKIPTYVFFIIYTLFDHYSRLNSLHAETLV